MDDQISVLLVILLVAIVAMIVAWIIATRKAREARYYRGLYEQKQTQAFQLGGSKVMGDLCQHLGTFAMLLEYDQGSNRLEHIFARLARLACDQREFAGFHRVQEEGRSNAAA